MILVRTILTILFLCLQIAPTFAQAEESNRLSIDALVGVARSGFLGGSPSASVSMRYHFKPRLLIGVTYEQYLFDVLQRILTPTGRIVIDYQNGYTISLYSGGDLIANEKFRLSLVAGPTLTQESGTETETVSSGLSFTYENDFRTSASPGVCLWLRGEHKLSDRFFGHAQLSCHQNLEDQYSRMALLVGAGVRF